jgi:PIN domain nuclease of toxin-antitoxin system
MGPDRLSASHDALIRDAANGGVGVSIMSCWEVARLSFRKKLELDRDVHVWIQMALDYPGVELIGLTPEIVIDSINLPGEFHRDPADQLLVATARSYGIPLLTEDRRILAYPHVLTR